MFTKMKKKIIMIAFTLTKERIKLKNQEVEKVSMRANTYSLNGHLILLPLVKVLKDYVRATPANWRAIQFYDVNHTLKLIACSHMVTVVLLNYHKPTNRV
jgi:hypothetical protein